MSGGQSELGLFDCPQRSIGDCESRRIRARCECVFLLSHDGAHFCKYCRQAIVTDEPAPAERPE